MTEKFIKAQIVESCERCPMGYWDEHGPGFGDFHCNMRKRVQIPDRIWYGSKIDPKCPLPDSYDTYFDEQDGSYDQEPRRADAIKPRLESVQNILSNLGAIARGRRVAVTVDYDLLENRRVGDFVGVGHRHDPEVVVEDALRKSILTIGDSKKFEQHYGLAPGTLWDMGDRTLGYDATKPIPPFISPKDK